MTTVENPVPTHARSEASIETACFRYLSSLGYTLWANWEIQRKERRRLAAKWFAFQMRKAIEQMNEDEWRELLELRPLGTRNFHAAQSRVWAWWHTFTSGVKR